MNLLKCCHALPGDRPLYSHIITSSNTSLVEDNAARGQKVCASVRVSLQKPDGVDVKMVEEVGVRRSSVGTLILHQVALQGLLAGVALLDHPQLKQKKHTAFFTVVARSVDSDCDESILV